MNLLLVGIAAGVVLLAACGPGPCLAHSLRAGLRRGPAAVVDVGIGYAVSGFCWVLGSLLVGVATLSEHEQVCATVSHVGGLVVVAVGGLMLAMLVVRGPSTAAVDQSEVPSSRVRRIGSSLVLHAASPGTIVLFLGVLPTLIATRCNVGAVEFGSAIVAAACAAAILLVVNLSLSQLLNVVANWLAKTRVRVILELAMGAALIVSGASLAL